MRDQLLDIYETQLLDNLIRIKRGEVFLHINYTVVAGKGASEVSAKGLIGTNETDTFGTDDNGDLVLTSEEDGVEWSAEAHAKLSTEMAVSGVPAIGQDFESLYAEYRRFAERHLKGPVLPAELNPFKALVWKTRPAKAFEKQVIRERFESQDRLAPQPNEITEVAYYILAEDQEEFLDLVQHTSLVQKVSFASAVPATSFKILNELKAIPSGSYARVSVKFEGEPAKEGLVFEIKGAASNISLEGDKHGAIGVVDEPGSYPVMKAGIVTFDLHSLVEDQVVTFLAKNDAKAVSAAKLLVK